MNSKKTVVVRGGGDIATGTIYALWNANYNIVVLEADRPSCIRRTVALSEAAYKGTASVMGMEGVLCRSLDEIRPLWDEHKIPVFCDPQAKLLDALKPDVLIDGILAKKNVGNTNMSMAPITIALGPGFCAGKDVDVVIETMRGHTLGTIIEDGYPIPDTATPGVIAGESIRRVMRASCEGEFKSVHKITDVVKEGDVIAEVITDSGERVPVYALIDGLIRGMLCDGYHVTEGFKVADIDPRANQGENCFIISDKARNIGGGVLMAIGRMERKKGLVN